MSSSRVLTFDCGAAHLSGGVFTAKPNGKLTLESHAIEALNDFSHEGKTWAAALGEALTRMRSRLDYQGRDCVVTVPGHLALTKFVKTPAVERSKRDRIVQFEASQNIPYPLNEVAWDHAEVADDGVDVELMFSAVKRDVLDELCAVFENVGLSVVRIEPAGLAAVRACRAAPDKSSGTSLVVDVGARSTQLLFVGRDNFFMRTLPFGGNLLTQILAKKLACELREAESIKCHLRSDRTEGSDGTRGELIDEAVTEFTARLQAELTRSIFSYSRHTEAESPQEIILMGGGSRLAGLDRRIAESTALPVRRWNAATDSSVLKADGGMPEDDSLLVLSGLAECRLGTAGVAMNLLPAERQAEQRARQTRPWWLAGAALLCLAFIPPISYLQLTTSRVEARNHAVARELGPLIKWDLQNRRNLERLDELRNRSEILKEIAERRDRWVFFLADIQSSLESVGDVWLERMVVLPGSLLSSDTEASAPLRLELSGKLLDTENPTSKTSAASNARVNQLQSSFEESKYVQSVSGGRFDNGQPGILKFELTLVINPEESL